MPKILFYIERDLHLPYLVPVMEELKKEPSVQAAFCAPEFIPSSGYKPGRGVPEDKLKQLREKAPVYEDPRDFSPDVTVVGDSCQFLLPEYPGPTVNVGHGLICKGTFYTEKPNSRRDNLSSVICVPGPWHKKRLESQVDIPIEITGFIKTDELLKKDPGYKKDFNRYCGVGEKAANILYAPTFNSELTSIPWVVPRLGDLAGQDINILIKLHNMTPAEHFRSCRKLAAENENITLLSDSDYIQMMHHSDVMISDVSSIFVEFMLLDKPVVLFRPPDIKKFNTFDPRDIEYRVRDAASETASPDALPDLVQKQLKNPGEKSQHRKKYRQALDYKRDGKSAKRAAKIIFQTLEKSAAPRQKSGKRFLILADGKDCTREQIAGTLQNVRRFGWEQKMDLLLLGGKDAHPESEDIIHADISSACREIDNGGADFLVFLQAGYCPPYDWAKHMALHMFWEDKTGVVRALAQKEVADSTLRYFQFEGTEKMSGPISARYLRTVGIGSKGTGICGPTACVLVPADAGRRVLRENKPDDCAELCRKVHENALSEQKRIITALDVFVHPNSGATPALPRY